MRQPPRLNRRQFVAAISSYLATAGVRADDFPQRTIRFIVPFPPGGGGDVFARALAERLSGRWKQPIVIENRPGANTIIGAQALAASPADGHAIMLATDATMSLNPALYKKLPYQADFAPVVQLASVTTLLVVRADSGIKTLNDFANKAADKPGGLSYGSYGNGSVPHLLSVRLAQRYRAAMLHVPYKGVTETTQALLAGEIDFMISGVSQPLPHIRSGKLHAIAMGLPSRSALLPDVPTFRELGVPGISNDSWFGLVAPRGTPEARLNSIAAAVTSELSDTGFLQRSFVAAGLEPAGGTPAEFAAFLATNREVYKRLVSDAQLTGSVGQ